MSKAETGWYTVRVLLRFVGPGDAPTRELYEDRMILVSARTHNEARRKAKRLCANDEFLYKNSLGQNVRWKFDTVVESIQLFEDEGLGEGTQVYWRFIRSTDVIKRLEREGLSKGLFTA